MDFKVEIINGKVYAQEYIGEDVDVVIPDEIEVISPIAFSKVVKKRELRNLYINAKCKEPSNCKCFENFYVDEQNPYMCSVDGVLYSKNKKILLAYPCRSKRKTYKILESVEVIAYYAFEDSNLEEIVLNSNIKIIRDFAFENCKNMTHIYFPDSVKYIGKSSLYKCNSLNEIRFPSQLDENCEYFRLFDGTIGSYGCGCPECAVKNVYKDFRRLKDKKFKICAFKGIILDYEQGIVPPNEVLKTYKTFFKRNKKDIYEYMELIKMPELAWFLLQEEIFPVEDALLFIQSLDNSETELINSIKQLSNISDEELNVEKWEYIEVGNEIQLTRYLGKSKRIIVPNVYDEKKVIGIWHAFRKMGIHTSSEHLHIIHAEDIEEVIISEGIEYFTEETFHGFKNLKYIKIPSTIKSIKITSFSTKFQNPFLECNKELVIDTNGNNQYIYENGILYDVVNKGVLYANPNLTGFISLRNDIKIIGVKAFYDSLIEEIVFPKSLEEIYDEGFSNCKYLKSFILNENFKKLHRGVLSGCTSVVDLHIPKDAVFAYGTLENLRKIEIN